MGISQIAYMTTSKAYWVNVFKGAQQEKALLFERKGQYPYYTPKNLYYKNQNCLC